MTRRCAAGCRRFGSGLGVALVLVIVLWAAASPADANPFGDVPAGHWAYGALEQLADASLIDGYSSGFFTGARRLTRYEMALSVAGALSRLKGEETLLGGDGQYDLDGLIADYNRRQPQRPVSQAEGELLRAVVQEFRSELSMLGYHVAAVSASPPAAAGDRGGYVLDGSFDALARQRLLAARGGQVRLRTLDTPSLSRGAWGESRWPPAAEELSRRASQVSTAVALGRIGSTVLLAETPESASRVEAWERTTMPLLDGTIHLSEYTLPGTALEHAVARAELLTLWPVTETVVGVEAVSVTPYLSLSGQRAQRTGLTVDTGATEVRATVLLGEDVALAGSVRTVEPGFPADGEAVGIGLTVRFGDVLLSTGRDFVHWSEADNPDEVTTLALEYSLAEQARVRAGWQTVSDTRSRTSVDLNVPVPQGALHLGVAYEGKRDEEAGRISMTTLTMAGLDLRVAANAEARAAFALQDSEKGRERTTSLGLRYSLSPEAALTLGYKFINFSGMSQEDESRPENVTTAEFTIRF